MVLIRGIFLSLVLLFSIQGFAQIGDSSSVNIDSVSVSGDSVNVDIVEEKMDELIKADSAKLKKVQIEFVKKKVEQSSDSSYFNLCKVTNTTSNTIQGNFKVSVPGDWNLIADPSTGLEIGPGETKVFAIRVSIPAKAVGGVAYVIDATLDTREGNYSGVSYIKVPLKSKWDMFVDKHTIYFNEYFDEMDFNVYIRNQGNASELLKMKLKIGKLLKVVDLPKDEFYVEVPAYTDTVLTFSVRRNDLNEDERIALKQIWKESVIGIEAVSGIAKKINESIWFKDLENIFTNTRQEKASPLNAEISVFNLMASRNPRVNLLLFGQILFKGDHDLGYIFQGRNLFYKGTGINDYFANPNNSTFRIDYKFADKLKATVGEIYNNSMHTLRGWGVSTTYNLNARDKISVSYIYGKYYPGWGLTGKYQTQLKKVGISVAETYEKNDYLKYEASSTEVGAYFSPIRNHQIRVGLMGTRSNFDITQLQGTSPDSVLYGLTYMMSYYGMVNKFRFGVSTRNDQYNVVRVRPSNTIQGNARYMINHKSRINATFNYHSMRTSRFVNNPYFNGNYNSQSIYRVTYLTNLKPNLAFEAGPSFRMLNRYVVDTNDVVISNFNNFFKGIYSQVRIRFDDYRILSPRISIGATGFKNKLDPSVKIPEMLSANIGFNYTDRNWGLSANYIHGPNFFISEEYFILDEENMETIHMRAYYDKYLLNRRVMFTGFATYYLRLPANRQNFVVSTRFNFDFTNRWSGFIVGNLFMNSLDETEEGVVSHRNFSLNAGLRKSFDIPQPRIKYYDLTIVCFNDFNGNGEREDNEPLLSNIKVKTSKNMDHPGAAELRFGEQELVTNTEGELRIIDIPEGGYIMEFEPLHNLGNLYNSKGDVQELVMSENMTLYIPYVESYKVRGRVILKRDEYSTNGLINVGGIRVSAITMEGEVYSALTDNDGNYLINVPQAGYYTVKVNNIFGDKFEVDKDEYLVQFNGFKSFNVDFTFFEGKRKVNINGGNFFNFSSLGTSATNSNNETNANNNVAENNSTTNTNTSVEPVNVPDNAMKNADEMKQSIDAVSVENEKTINMPIDPDKVKFMVEIGIYVGEVPIEVANKMMELGIIPTPIKIDGMTVYATQVVSTNAEVKDLHNKIVNAGFNQAIVVGSYDGKVISEEKAIQYKNQ